MQKFIMNHINKCIYEKELEWNGIVNNKAWSIPSPPSFEQKDGFFKIN